ncbi:unnamed protein product [Linum trigynum]|uniref:Protein unc-45 homolog B n=1 Tax=Linum trigynum TaxID=586398 RepID=A0AAV2FCB8_9ROSI
MPSIESHENVLILSELWTIAMHHPDDPQLPSLGIFASMAALIQKAIKSPSWLLHDQNIYIPYYAAHVIGSYTMNKPEFAEQAVESGVIPPLLDLLGGKISWVEQRVAVRALGHLASYQATFEAVAVYEREVVELAMELACSAADVVYKEFVGVKDGALRLKYHCDLLTRGVGGSEMEERKAEEWAGQVQCWSLYLLNCFASKERSITLICSRVGFLERLSKMWGGVANHSSPAGIGLIRILCYYKAGRKKIAESEQVIRSLCNISRSSDDWQYMGIDCLVLLLRDRETRYRVMELASLCLVDLVEVKNLGHYRSNVGETVAEALLLDYKLQWKVQQLKGNERVEKRLEEVWSLKVGRRKKERTMSKERLEERKVLAMLIKQQAKRFFVVGEVEEAMAKYGEALETCPLRFRKERMCLYGDRAECRWVVGDVDGAISDSTRAISLSSTADGNRSLWRRAKGYEMKGMAKECLMDCIMYVSGCVKMERRRGVGVIPYDAVHLMSKMMDATWLFAAAKSAKADELLVKDDENGELEEIVMRMVMETKGDISLSGDVGEGLSTIVEEEPSGKEYLSRRKLARPRTGKKKPQSL